MVTADHSFTSIALPMLSGVRQRMLLILLAATLGVVTQSSSSGLPPDGMKGDLQATVSISGERFRFTCHGSGSATVLFLESDGANSVALWAEAVDGAPAFARACTLKAEDGGGHTALLTPENRDRMATDLDAVLAAQGVPVPYVIIATTELEPVVAHVIERNATLVNGGLLIEPAGQPLAGWMIWAGGDRRAVKLGTIDHLVLAIRSLVWPPRSR